MYPDLSRVEYNKVLAGKVFKVRINSAGLMVQSRRVECDLKEWEACQDCEQYRNCYDLSIGALLLQRAVVGIT
jgi:hypothetical protein